MGPKARMHQYLATSNPLPSYNIGAVVNRGAGEGGGFPFSTMVLEKITPVRDNEWGPTAYLPQGRLFTSVNTLSYPPLKLGDRLLVSHFWESLSPTSSPWCFPGFVHRSRHPPDLPGDNIMDEHYRQDSHLILTSFRI